MDRTRPKARIVANYLPQFHPVRENDAWWGAGFTEWRNVAAARPLFPGHEQPRLPADLGFYDLRVPEVREAQAEMAAAAGIEAFCYWHYWFGGRRLLERPLQEVLRSGQPDFPFCIGWANQSWTGIWHGAPERMLIEQTYPGREDYIRHFEYLRPALEDPRYFRVHGRPLILVFAPDDIPDLKRFLDLWRELAQKAGIGELHFVAYKRDSWPTGSFGFDASTWSYHGALMRWRPPTPWRRRWRRVMGWPEHIYLWDEAVPWMHGSLHPDVPVSDAHYPTIVAGWDNSPRSGRRALILHRFNLPGFRRHVRSVLARVRHKPAEHRIVFLKSWNEWAEGNYMEPDLIDGHGRLEVLREELFREEE